MTTDTTRADLREVLDGVAQRMRLEGGKKTRFATLSRGVCGCDGLPRKVARP